MLSLGRFHNLRILEETPHGLALDGGGEGSILLPRRYCTKDMKIGDSVRVFLSTDTRDRLVATTETPLLQSGEIGTLRVVSLHERYGAFLDWGLSKDLLLPYREQENKNLKPGDRVVVAVFVDPESDRVIASTRLHRHLPPETPEFDPAQAVSTLIYGITDLGYKALVEGRFPGLLYHSETAGTLRVGDTLTAYVKQVRPDGRLDLLRDAPGYGKIEGLTQSIRHQLREENGFLPFHDRSPPEDIRHTFHCSKKAFKQAVGALLKNKEIRLTDEGMFLTK